MPDHEGIAKDPQAELIDKQKAQQQGIETGQEITADAVPEVPEGHVSMAEGLEEYKKTGKIPDGCPISKLGKIARDEIIEKHIDAQNDPDRKPTMREILAAKAAEKEVATKEALILAKEDTPTKVTEAINTVLLREEISLEKQRTDLFDESNDVVLETSVKAMQPEINNDILINELTQEAEVVDELPETASENVQNSIIHVQATESHTTPAIETTEKAVPIEIVKPDATPVEVTPIQEVLQTVDTPEEQPDIITEESNEVPNPEHTLFNLLKAELVEQEQPEVGVESSPLNEIQDVLVAETEIQSLQQHIEALNTKEKTEATDLFEEVTKLSVELGSDKLTDNEREKAEEHLEGLCKRLFEVLGFEVPEKRLKQIVTDIIELSVEAIDQQISIDQLNAAGTYEHRVSVFSKMKTHLLALAAKKLKLQLELSKYMLANTIQQLAN